MRFTRSVDPTGEPAISTAGRTTSMPRLRHTHCSGGRRAAVPKSGTGQMEIIRHLKVARDTAAKARTQAMLTLKSLIVEASAALREQLDALRGNRTPLRHLAALRPGAFTTTLASARPVCIPWPDARSPSTTRSTRTMRISTGSSGVTRR